MLTIRSLKQRYLIGSTLSFNSVGFFLCGLPLYVYGKRSARENTINEENTFPMFVEKGNLQKYGLIDFSPLPQSIL